MAKPKQKTTADMTPQELIKSLTPSFGELIKAEIRTAEITIKANTDAAIKASEERMKAHTEASIKISEERLTKRIDALEQKIDKVTQDHEERIEHLEEHAGISNPHKN